MTATSFLVLILFYQYVTPLYDSVEIVKEDVMEVGSASDGSTNKQWDKQPSENCSSTDVLKAVPTTNN
jgi:hypothetical protein